MNLNKYLSCFMKLKTNLLRKLIYLPFQKHKKFSSYTMTVFGIITWSMILIVLFGNLCKTFYTYTLLLHAAYIRGVLPSLHCIFKSAPWLMRYLIISGWL